MFMPGERCGLEESSLVEVKHLYQLRSSPKEVGWYYFMSRSAKRKSITGFPSSCKNWKNKFFFAGENWCPAVQSLGGDIYLPTHFVTPGRLFLPIFLIKLPLIGFFNIFALSESWGLIEGLED